jgi:hypothetical protein
LEGKEVLEICPVEKGTRHRLLPLGGCGVALCKVTCYDAMMPLTKLGTWAIVLPCPSAKT